MSLIAWYPLNGDTLDYSGNENHATNVGATVNSNGKIGQCYSFNPNYMSLPNLNMGNSNFTLAAWIKSPSLGSGMSVGGIVSISYGAVMLINGSGYLTLRLDNGSSIVNYSTTNISLFDNIWHHCVSSYDGMNANIYIDGVKIYSVAVTYKNRYTSPATIGTDPNNTSVYEFYGLMNDVRIYNHVLSDKEVYELSKAKILHYTFNEFQESTENIECRFADTMGSDRPINSWSHSSISNVTGQANVPDSPVPGRKVWKIQDSNPDNYSRFGVSSRLITDIGGYDITYTASIYVYIPSGITLGDQLGCWAYQNSTGTDWHGTRGYDATYSFYGAGSIASRTIQADPNKRNVWQRLEITFKPLTSNINVTGGTDPAENNKYVVFQFHPNLINQDGSSYIYVSCLQLEAKGYTTPFVYGTRTDKITDCSGFENNSTLTLATTPVWSSDSKLGSGCYKIDSNKLIKIDNTVQVNVENFSVSVWFKALSFPTEIGYIIHRSAFDIIGTSIYGLATWSDSKLYSFVNGANYISTPISLNTWYHAVLTYNGSQQKLYLNGTLVGTYNVGAITNNTSNNKIGIGGTPNNIGYRSYNGLIDDVRIYTTALSDQDIKDLYEVRASLDKNGDLYTNQIKSTGYKPTVVDYTQWKVGVSGSQGDWAANGSLAENTVVIKENPIGELDLVWATPSNDATSDADGGWDHTSKPIDRTKKYRASVWIRRENAGSGTTYFGCLANSVFNLGTTTLNSNPYFGYPSISSCPELKDNWVLFVAYIHEDGYAGTTDPTTGIYNYKTKTKVSSYSLWDYKWSDTATTGRIRSYLYYSTSTGERQYWYRPRFEICDGNEPTIEELLDCVEHLPLIDSSGNYNHITNLSDSGIYKMTKVSEVGPVDGLVGWWKLNGDVLDYSGNNFHGIVTNVPTIVAGPNMKNALLLTGVATDGADSTANIIKVPVTGITFTNGITFCGWTYKDSADAIYRVLWDTSGGGSLIWETSSQLTVRIAGVNTSYRSWASIPFGQWNFFCAIYDPIAGTISLWLNGTKIKEYTGETGTPTVSTMYIGSVSDGNRSLRGKVYDFRVYNKPLSSEEMNILYNIGVNNSLMQITNNGTLYTTNELREV